MGDCTINPGDYTTNSFKKLGWNAIPFIGPSIASIVVSDVPNHAADLKKAQDALGTATTSFQTAIAGLTETNTKNAFDLVTVLGGNDSSDGYVNAVASYIIEPIDERSKINQVNIFFLGVMISLVIFYILYNKNG